MAACSLWLSHSLRRHCLLPAGMLPECPWAVSRAPLASPAQGLCANRQGTGGTHTQFRRDPPGLEL